MDENEIEKNYIGDCDIEILSSSKSLGYNIKDKLIGRINLMLEDGKTDEEIFEFVEDFVFEFRMLCESLSIDQILNFRKERGIRFATK